MRDKINIAFWLYIDTNNNYNDDEIPMLVSLFEDFYMQLTWDDRAMTDTDREHIVFAWCYAHGWLIHDANNVAKMLCEDVLHIKYHQQLENIHLLGNIVGGVAQHIKTILSDNLEEHSTQKIDLDAATQKIISTLDLLVENKHNAEFIAAGLNTVLYELGWLTNVNSMAEVIWELYFTNQYPF